ncbi:MAG: UxaA family hydrolase [Rhodospirillales bacterium]|nr:UxaA family hydrolase [Rhodospirillales bacterium]
MSGTDFLVHDDGDSVGVVVVEGVESGATLTGLEMESGKSVTMTALAAIPLGHKIALRDFKQGDTVLKYGHDIGKIVADAKAGDHIHVHNMKTKRW